VRGWVCFRLIACLFGFRFPHLELLSEKNTKQKQGMRVEHWFARKKMGGKWFGNKKENIH